MDLAARFHEWATVHAPDLRCPVCQERKFSVDSTIAMTNAIDPANERINYMSGFPLLVVSCARCAHTLFFNAKAVGVMQ